MESGVREESGSSMPDAANDNKTQKWYPFRGILQDTRARRPCYRRDWQDGCNSGIRILAPAIYIFFASAIPALAFGQQMSAETGGILTVVHILAATAITGVLQSVIGGQPLLIVGVSEPITLIYGYCYTFGEDREGLGAPLFLAWMGWVCVWAAFMVLGLAVFNACDYTDRFTRLPGEMFGMLIAVLFMQQAIKGTLGEFRDNKTPLSNSSPEADEFQWRLSNGLWALFVAFGTVLCALKVEQARSWRFFNLPVRSFLADYGVTLAVVAWSCLSYALSGAPPGVPRRLALPNTWEVKRTWTVANEMAQVPGTYIAAALIPALLIAILFYFDHTVSAQMAQLDEFGLRRPPTYHLDLFLLGWMTLLCGLIGLPPVNGVLPQAPLHTKSLITLKEQNVRRALKLAVKEPSGTHAEMVDSLAAECHKAGAPKAADHVLTHGPRILEQSGQGTEEGGNVGEAVQTLLVPSLPAEGHEQRMTNLIQSLLVAACLGITPGLKKMPTSVLWAYFAYLAIASLPGSEFWERFLLLFVEPSHRSPKFPGAADIPWYGRVNFRVVALFTLFQAVFTGIVYGITWIPIAGVIFPVPILLLIPIREFILPRVFGRKNLAALDPAPYEDEEGRPLHAARQSATPGEQEDGVNGAASQEANDSRDVEMAGR